MRSIFHGTFFKKFSKRNIFTLVNNNGERVRKKEIGKYKREGKRKNISAGVAGNILGISSEQNNDNNTLREKINKTNRK